MSLNTWKQEFYPVPASECPEEQAIQHSLRKWQGLTPENLKKHGVFYSKPLVAIVEDAEAKGLTRRLCISGATCALCFHYYRNMEERATACVKCPYERYFGTNCEAQSPSPYVTFITTGDPQPMIAALTDLWENYK